MNTFEDKVAIVTGGSSGIGAAAAKAFAENGAKVVVAARREAESEAVVGEIREGGGEAMFVRTDVAKGSDVEALVGKTVDAYGRLDYAFNNAGVGGKGPLLECDEEVWDRTININLKGVWWSMKYQIPAMLETGGGAIVNCASVLGLIGTAGAGHYIASKHGVVGLTKSVALEYAKQGIRVNAVCPGWIRTEMTEDLLDDPERGAWAMSMTPMERAGQPEEIAGAVVWLCSDAASLTTGVALPIDAGITAR